MSFTDWTKHTGSSLDLNAIQASSPGPYPSGVGGAYLKVAKSASDAGFRSALYQNKAVGTIQGSHQVSAAFFLGNNSTNVRAGIVTLWGGSSLDDTDGYVLELQGGASTTTLALRRGPGAGTVLKTVAGPVTGAWGHFVLQVRYDRANNQQIWVGSNAGSVLTPAWTLALQQVVTERSLAIHSGVTGFYVYANNPAFEARFDHLQVKSILQVVS